MRWEVQIMPSRTSCFKTLLRSDWRHYWPIAFLYTLVWLVALPVPLWQQTSWPQENMPMAVRLQNAMSYADMAALWMCLIFAVLAAMAVWSYLMKASFTQFMHALPVTRGTQYAAHFTAGFSLLTAAHVVTLLAVILVMASRGVLLWSACLHWFLVAELTALFYFSLATLCCAITGWLLAVPVFYAGLNCVFIVGAELVKELVRQCGYWGYYGGSGFPRFVYLLTPAYQMAQNYGSVYQSGEPELYGTYSFDVHALSTAAVYAAVGLVLALAAYLLYRLRSSESAGDAVSFAWLRPIVQWVITLFGGVGLGIAFTMVFLGERDLIRAVVFMCLFGVLCYIAVEMLLQKRYKVFTRRLLICCCICCAVIIGLCAALRAGVFGYEKRGPAAAQVQSVAVGGETNGTAVVEDAALIEKIVTLHRKVAALPPAERDALEMGTAAASEKTWVSLRLNYELKNGASLSRWYNFPVGGETLRLINEILNDPTVRSQTIFPKYDPRHVEGVTGAIVEGTYHDLGLTDREEDNWESHTFSLTAEQAKELYTTLGRESREKGTYDVSQGGNADVYITFSIPSREEHSEHIYRDESYLNLNLNRCPRTRELLKELLSDAREISRSDEWEDWEDQEIWDTQADWDAEDTCTEETGCATTAGVSTVQRA